MRRAGWLIALFSVVMLRWMWPPDEQLELFNRIWISRLPGDESDVIETLVLLADQETGRFEQGSAYRGDFDVFSFVERDGVLQAHLLQDHRRFEVKYRVTR